MPRFFKQNLLSSNLDTPELPRDDAQAQEWMHPHHTQPVSHSTQDDFDDDYYDPVKTILTWQASSRPFRKKDRSFYTTATILVVLTSLIALLAGQIMLIGVLFALLFLVYVLNFIPPQEAHYKISTQGITLDDHFYHWEELDSFWFNEKEGHKLLYVLTHLRFPGVVIMVLGDEVSQDEVKRVVARYLPFHEIAPKTLMDKWSESLQKHFPLENPHKSPI